MLDRRAFGKAVGAALAWIGIDRAAPGEDLTSIYFDGVPLGEEPIGDPQETVLYCATGCKRGEVMMQRADPARFVVALEDVAPGTCGRFCQQGEVDALLHL